LRPFFRGGNFPFKFHLRDFSRRVFAGQFPRPAQNTLIAPSYFSRARIAAARIEFFRTKIFYLVNDRGAKSRGCA